MGAVAVVICSHRADRWVHLVRAVSSVLTQEHPCEQVVVVIDGDRGLAQRATAELDQRCEIVARPHRGGLSVARNDGIARVRTPLVAFLDDDAWAEPDWLAELVAQLDDDVLGVGGRSVPNWLAPRPSWFPDELLWALGCSYAGGPDRVATVRNVFGGCALYRTDVFHTVGGFHPTLGRGAGRGVGGAEETELCIRAARALPGRRFLYTPRAVIHHAIPADRATMRYVLRRAFGEGSSKANLRQLAGGRTLGTEHRYVADTALPAIRQGVRDAFRRDPHGLSRALSVAAALGAAAAGLVAGTLGGAPNQPAAPTTEAVASGLEGRPQ